MRYKISIVLLLFCYAGMQRAVAQKPFSEGVIVYKVKLRSDDGKEYGGIYMFTFKGAQVKKELKLNNGFYDVELYDFSSGKAYSLQTMNKVKYAIQLNMADILKRQQPFSGYTLTNEENNDKKIAGCAVYKAKLNYKDGSASDVYYTKDWYPTQASSFERFPDAHFLPITYSYKDAQGITMQFEAEKVESGPVENAVFRIAPDYKMISNEEYRQLSR